MAYNKSTRKLPAAITYRRMVKEAVYRRALHHFEASTTPTNLLGCDAASKNLIKFTCTIEKSTLSVGAVMRRWDCHDMLTIPDVGPDYLSMSNVTAALSNPAQQRVLLLSPFDSSKSSLFRVK